MIGFIWPSGLRKEVKNLKILQMDGRTINNRWSEKLRFRWGKNDIFFLWSSILTMILVVDKLYIPPWTPALVKGWNGEGVGGSLTEQIKTTLYEDTCIVISQSIALIYIWFSFNIFMLNFIPPRPDKKYVSHSLNNFESVPYEDVCIEMLNYTIINDFCRFPPVYIHVELWTVWCLKISPGNG